MFYKLTSRLLFVVSLLVLSATQQVFSAEQTIEPAVAAVNISEKININTATNKLLAKIKGIGVKKAQAIIDYRQKNGDFVSLEQLVKVKGIGKGTLKKIEPFLTL